MNHRTVCSVSNCRTALRSLLLAILLSTLTGYGCRGAAANAEKVLTLPKLIDGVVTRSASLNYITEQDSEVFAFYRNNPVGETNEEELLGLLRRPPESQIFRQSWSTFFQLRTQNDSTGRWRNLQEYLEAHLTDRTVFRVPRDAPYDSQYDLYAVGLFNGTTVVGVQMFGVAT